MLEFKVVIDKKEAQNYVSSKGVDMDISKMMVMCAFDGEDIVCVGALSIENGVGIIELICAEDDALEYGMGKTLLNSLDLGGIKDVLIKNDALKELGKRLRFNKGEDEIMTLSLEGYFTAGC